MADLSVEAKQSYESLRRNPFLEPLTRLGFICKGLVYLLIASLSLLLVFRAGGQTTDTKGAMHWIAAHPFGSIALIAVAVGMSAYALWRVICAFSGTERDGTDPKGMGSRAAHIVSAIAHGAIAVYAVRLLTRSSASHGKNEAKAWTAKVLSLPGGELIVGVAGLILIGSGLFQIRKGVRGEFKKDLRTAHMSSAEESWGTGTGRFGHCARGITLALIGLFLMLAAWRQDPRQVRSLEGVLDTVAAQPYGPWLLGLLAAGLGCYGIYCILEARYRRIRH